MAGIADFLRREGWRVNQVEKGCPEDFPLHMGITFLIGRQLEQASNGAGGQAPQASGIATASRTGEAKGSPPAAGRASQYCIVWLDSENRVQSRPISLSGSRMDITFGGQDYKLTAETVKMDGRTCLKGTVSKRENGKGKNQQDKLNPGTGYSTSGTWGAEGNGGGQGGGGVWPGPVAAACAEVASEAKEAVEAASASLKKKLAGD